LVRTRNCKSKSINSYVRGGRLRPRQNNLEDVKGLRRQSLHNIFNAAENLELHIRKRTSKIYFTVNKYIHTNPAYILFFDIHLVLSGNNTEF
jgi:DNA-directed RNA polymerase alpha subunit